MNTFKTALSSAVALGLVLTGTAANAEAIRSAAATPGVVSVNKSKLVRTAAPADKESKAIITQSSTLWMAALAAVLAGVATYIIVDDGNDVIDSPGA